MAGFINPEACDPAAYCGLERIYEFTNWDGELCRTNCGQAAAATLLTHHGRFNPELQGAKAVMALLERSHPPDQFFGRFGTGRRRVERIFRAHGLAVEEVSGEESLRGQLSARNPVAVMLGLSGGRLWNWLDLPGGHWMVAYGFDERQVYLTNHGPMTWAEFRNGWRALVPRLIRMRGRGLVVTDANAACGLAVC